MAYTSLSVKEAMERINADSNGWFLPYAQRPYVWGARYESEKYICRLFDSILQGYPIGIFIIWNSNQKVPYRKFMDSYVIGQEAKIVEPEHWDRSDKWLVYDGQQRLQTIYSCLKDSLNGRKLAYNLKKAIENYQNEECYNDSFDLDDDNQICFEFYDKGTPVPDGCILMSLLFTKKDEKSEQIKFRNEIKNKCSISDQSEAIFEALFDELWDTFVSKNKKCLSYFAIEKDWNENKVNNVFHRLNTGGIPLSGADLLLFKIKKSDHQFEEQLRDKVSGLNSIGSYIFSPENVLQIMNVITTGQIRIDAERTNNTQIQNFIKVADKVYRALEKFLNHFMLGSFQINKNSIVPKLLALYPIIVYIYKMSEKGIAYQDISNENAKKIKQYFILSQLNDWNTATIVSYGCKLALENNNLEFPFNEIKEYIGKRNRYTSLKLSTVESSSWWFTLKVLIPNKAFSWYQSRGERYEPELDHIFPRKLPNPPENYCPDVLWNLQPISGTINGDKGNLHPLTYFINHESELNKYDYVLSINDILWNDPIKFILKRKSLMIQGFKNLYDINMDLDS